MLSSLLILLWGPASEAQGEPVRAFLSVVESIDPDPNETLFKTHYITSNERHHIASLKYAHETGGVFIGIGTDQNFVLIPTLRPSHIVMMDFDQWAVDTHSIYRHLFRTRSTPAEFLDFFKEERFASKRRELREHGVTPEVGRRMERVFARYRADILKRLRAVRNRLNGKSVRGYLNDQATYDYLREFVLSGRYAAVRGDLTKDRTLLALAHALKAMGLEVGAMALTNAEQYFDYTRTFTRNMRAFDYRPNALVLRTFRVEGRHYEYYLQSTSAFLESLKEPRIRNITRLINRRLTTPHPRIFLLPGLASCAEGLCPFVVPCQGIPHEGCCDGTTLHWCLFETLQTLDCSIGEPATCGWSTEQGKYTCGADSEEPSQFPIPCP